MVRTEALRAAGYDAEMPVVGRTHALRVEASGTYHLDLRSYLFDPYLVLHDGDGRVLAEDDDGLIAQHARIVTHLQAGVDYRVTACALHGRRGAFELLVVAGLPAGRGHARRRLPHGVGGGGARPLGGEARRALGLRNGMAVFFAALVCMAAVAVRAARTGQSWGVTAAQTSLAAMSCAAIVLGRYAVSTAFGTGAIRQVPEFIRDYTNNGYTSPATYFAERYWGLLQLQVFTWVIGVAGLVAVGTVMGRVAARLWPQRAA